MTKRSGTGIGSVDAYELVEYREESSDGFRLTDSLDSTCAQDTRALPPKTLHGYRTKRSIVINVIVLFVLIAGLILLLWLLKSAIPWDVSVSVSNDDSCDLETASGSMQSAFTINLRCQSHLKFAEAKAVDVAWDLFVGQGGRFLMGWISYKVFMDGLLRVMEKSTVSYALYASMAFEPNSLMSIWNSIRALSMTKGWRSRALLIWFSISTIYVLAFSTLISAGSGYVTPSSAGFMMYDGSFVTAASDTLNACYNLTDGALIGHPNGTIVPGPPYRVLQDPQNAPPKYDKVKASSSELFYTLYTYPYSPGIRPIFAKANGSQLAPAGYGRPYKTNITVEGHTYVFDNFTFRPEQTYCYQNHSLPDDLTSIAKCLPEPYFVWGWSSLLLYITLALQLAWIVGMFSVWLDANLNSQLCRNGRKVRGYFRAAADVSEAMKETLGEEFCAYSDAEIAKELKKELTGLGYYTSYAKDGDVSHIGISSKQRNSLLIKDDITYGTYTTCRE